MRSGGTTLFDCGDEPLTLTLSLERRHVGVRLTVTTGCNVGHPEVAVTSQWEVRCDLSTLGKPCVDFFLDRILLTGVHLGHVDTCTDGFPNLVVHLFVRVTHAAVGLTTCGADGLEVFLHGIPRLQLLLLGQLLAALGSLVTLGVSLLVGFTWNRWVNLVDGAGVDQTVEGVE